MSFEIFTEEDRQKERELLATYDLDVSFFRQLGFRIKQIVPERNCFRIEADKGFYCLKKMNISHEEMKLMQDMTAHLRQKGFDNTFDIVLQDNNTALIPYKGNEYYLTRWMDGRESDYLNLLDIKSAVGALARFHREAEGFEHGFRAEHRWLFGRWKQGFHSRLQDIKAAREQVGADTGGENSGIIASYLEQCENNARYAMRLVEQTFYDRINARDEGKQGFIHHDYGFHNILHTFDNKIYIGGLESFAFDIRMHDLGHFIYRLMRRKGWDLDAVLDIIECYDEVYRLEKEDYEALTVYFTFPHDFRQLYRQHYIEGREVDDLEELDRINIESDYNIERSRFLKEFEKYSGLL